MTTKSQPKQREASPEAAGLKQGTATRAAPMSLQRSLGNRATGRLLRCELRVGEANDPQEQEADGVARIPLVEPQPQNRRTLAALAVAGVRNSALEALAATGGSRAGEPLDPDLRHRAERATGAVLDDVRVYDDTEAAHASAALGARAFTIGQDIVLGAGVRHGANEVLAHEVAHAVQQRGASRVDDGLASSASALEQEASTAANAILFGGRVHLSFSSARTIQRYESYEHAFVADEVAKGTEKFVIYANGKPFEITAGEVNALADYYADFNEFRAATQKKPEKVKALVLLIRKQRENPKSVDEGDWNDATGGDYTERNLKNSPHFGRSDPALAKPSGTTVKDNRATFLEGHKAALADAKAAAEAAYPAARKKMLERAKMANAFIEHFLVDAFAAGHAFSKEDAMATMRETITKWSDATRNAVFRKVANIVFNRHGALISQYETPDSPNWDIDSDGRFADLLARIWKEKPEAVLSALAKVAHDRLNTYRTDGSEEAKHGVEFEDDDKHKWRMSGDKSLRENEQTQKRIAHAIEVSRANLREAATGKYDEAVLCARIERLWPRPTTESAVLIRSEVEKVSLDSQRMAGALTELLLVEAPSLMKGLVTAGKLRHKEVTRK